MKVVKRNDLNRFVSRLNDVEKNAPQKSAEMVANRGVEIATEEYGGDTHIVVSSVVNDDGTAQVLASGKGVSYMEFGTGWVAKKEPYKGQLPQTGVPITENWEYYYDSPAKMEIDGKKGWKFGETFTEGQKPGEQMFRTTQRLKQKLNYKGD